MQNTELHEEKLEIGDLVYLEINKNLDPQIQKDKTTFNGIFKIDKIFKTELKLSPFYEINTTEVPEKIESKPGEIFQYPDEPIIKLSANKELNFKKYENNGKIVTDERGKSILIDLEKSIISRLPNDSSLQPKWYIVTCLWESWDSKQNQMK